MIRPAPQDPGLVASAAGFVESLREENAELLAFIRALRAEQDALMHGDADRVDRLAPDKASHIENLNRLGEQRSRHLEAHSLKSNAEGMTAWLKRNPQYALAGGKTWRELLAQAETARQINQNNGILIENNLQQTRVKLAVLQTSVASDGVYRPDGKLRPLSNTRTFGAL